MGKSAASEGTPGIADSHQDLEQAGKGFLLLVSEGGGLTDSVISGFWPPHMNESISVVTSHPVPRASLWQSFKTNKTSNNHYEY